MGWVGVVWACVAESVQGTWVGVGRVGACRARGLTRAAQEIASGRARGEFTGSVYPWMLGLAPFYLQPSHATTLQALW